MCQATIRIISRSLEGITNAELLLEIKDDLALFIQTMEVRIHVAQLASLLLTTGIGLGLFRLNSQQLSTCAIPQICRVVAAPFW